MRLLDVVVSSRWLDKKLKETSFYIRIEERSLLDRVIRLGKMPAEDMMSTLQDRINGFQEASSKVISAIETALGLQLKTEDAAECWASDTMKLNICRRALAEGVESREQLLEKLREANDALLQEEIHFRLEDLTSRS